MERVLAVVGDLPREAGARRDVLEGWIPEDRPARQRSPLKVRHARFTSVELVRRGEELVADAHVHRQVALRRPVVLHVEADEVLTPAASGRRSRRLPLVGVRPVLDEILERRERVVAAEVERRVLIVHVAREVDARLHVVAAVGPDEVVDDLQALQIDERGRVRIGPERREARDRDVAEARARHEEQLRVERGPLDVVGRFVRAVPRHLRHVEQVRADDPLVLGDERLRLRARIGRPQRNRLILIDLRLVPRVPR